MSPLVLEVMHGVSTILGSERCTLFISDPETKQLWATSKHRDETILIDFPNDQGLAGHVFTTQQVLNVHDCFSDPRFAVFNDQEGDEYTIRTILAAPVIHPMEEKVLAVVQAVNKVGGVFTAEDEVHLQRLCTLLAVILVTSDRLEQVYVQAELKEWTFQRLPVPVLLFNGDGRCIKANQRVGDLLGLPQESLVGCHCAEVFQGCFQLFAMWERCLEDDQDGSAEQVEVPAPGGTKTVIVRCTRTMVEGSAIGTTFVFTPGVLEDAKRRRLHRAQTAATGVETVDDSDRGSPLPSPTESMIDP